MPRTASDNNRLDVLITELQGFLERSLHDNDLPLREWLEDSVTPIASRCWLVQRCGAADCPAFNSDDRRCWLIAGTLCGGEVQGKLTEKYPSCTACGFYRQVVGDDPVRQLRELVIALIHSLYLRQEELRATRSEVKILSGLLPICISCKKIRDDQGYWTRLESYIHQHSEAQFTHGICPECIDKLYPGLMESKPDGHYE